MSWLNSFRTDASSASGIRLQRRLNVRRAGGEQSGHKRDKPHEYLSEIVYLGPWATGGGGVLGWSFEMCEVRRYQVAKVASPLEWTLAHVEGLLQPNPPKVSPEELGPPVVWIREHGVTDGCVACKQVKEKGTAHSRVHSKACRDRYWQWLTDEMNARKRKLEQDGAPMEVMPDVAMPSLPVPPVIPQSAGPSQPAPVSSGDPGGEMDVSSDAGDSMDVSAFEDVETVLLEDMIRKETNQFLKKLEQSTRGGSWHECELNGRRIWQQLPENRKWVSARTRTCVRACVRACVGGWVGGWVAGWVGADTQTRTHADTQTRRHADTQTRRHADTQTRRHPDTQTPRHPDTQTPRHPDTQTPRHPDTQTPRHPDTGARARTHARTHARKRARKHARMRARTHARRPARLRAHARTPGPVATQNACQNQTFSSVVFFQFFKAAAGRCV